MQRCGGGGRDETLSTVCPLPWLQQPNHQMVLATAATVLGLQRHAYHHKAPCVVPSIDHSLVHVEMFGLSVEWFSTTTMYTYNEVGERGVVRRDADPRRYRAVRRFNRWGQLKATMTNPREEQRKKRRSMHFGRRHRGVLQ
ncbi:hypothetical protein H257_15044 [Aphanomyces astaci]|uniref:Uncharacterized protein n=1 Tax=Aphanomyces astaci TaxID=112090 RepID=W4FP24_APHAT|nr:hypothetical protein H257_15044 [Aphanomyces astaci]ETV69225.1 hypothetical protein H257_15044 [Aphanomyces astaci]|eukprot:XP_009841327.1 hypothetical protein H257_15044 [Aphanomyces astaci]